MGVATFPSSFCDVHGTLVAVCLTEVSTVACHRSSSTLLPVEYSELPAIVNGRAYKITDIAALRVMLDWCLLLSPMPAEAGCRPSARRSSQAHSEASTAAPPQRCRRRSNHGRQGDCGYATLTGTAFNPNCIQPVLPGHGRLISIVTHEPSCLQLQYSPDTFPR